MEYLPKAIVIAGEALDKYFRGISEGEHDFRWIQVSLEYPAFHHLCFGFKNQIYSVIIAILDEENKIVIDPTLVGNQERECMENNLLPCMIILKKGRPLLQFPLVCTEKLDYKDARSVNPKDLDLTERIPISKWEVSSIGVEIVRNSLTKESAIIHSYSDVIGIRPNIWFEKDGQMSTVFVSTKGSGHSINCKDITLSKEDRKRIENFKCYTAHVEISSPDSPTLYRGEPFFVKYDGLKPLNLNTVKDGETYFIR